jgi:5-methylthioadenosine/S-adenosylhomocysteine deaminase
MPLDVDFAKARRAAEASLSHLFRAGGYDPDCLEERFPDLGGQKPAAWKGN